MDFGGFSNDENGSGQGLAEKENTVRLEVSGQSCVKIRQDLIEAYERQSNDLEVVFKCKNDEYRAGRLVLTCVSHFFGSQLDARNRMNNELVFNYPAHPKSVVKNFLDLIHSLKVKLDLIDVLRLIEFLKYEGKTGGSEFENDLLNNLCKKLADSNMQAAQKLLICLVCDSFDDFEGVMSKSLFENLTAEETVNSLLMIDLTTGMNKKLKKMINGGTNSDTEIENQLYAMIKKMKKNKVTKQVVTVKFRPHYHSRHQTKQFSHGVDKSGTTKQLVSELNDKLKEIFSGERVVVVDLLFGEIRLDEDVSFSIWVRNLKDGTMLKWSCINPLPQVLYIKGQNKIHFTCAYVT